MPTENEMKFFDLHIEYLKFLLIWPKNGQSNIMFVIKSNLIMLPAYVSSLTTLIGIFRQIAWKMDDVEVLIDGSIGIIDFLGCIYMRLCIMKNAKNIQIIFDKIYDFRQFCKDDDFLDTENKIKKFTKCKYVAVERHNFNKYISYSFILSGGKCGESFDSGSQSGELQINKTSRFNNTRSMRPPMSVLFSRRCVTFSCCILYFYFAILHRPHRHHVRFKYHHAVDRSFDPPNRPVETLQKTVARNRRSTQCGQKAD